MICVNKEPIYICNNDLYKYVCEYYPSNGTYKEILRPSDVKLWRGFYVNMKGVFIGVFASPEGPVLFRNEEQFVLRQGQYSFELEKKPETRIFTFKMNGVENFSIEYERYKYIDYDPWSTEEFVDFFM